MCHVTLNLEENVSCNLIWFDTKLLRRQRLVSDARRNVRLYTTIKDRKSPLKGRRPSVPHGTNFFFIKRSLKIPSEITFETTETNWVCVIVFLCAHVRISISTYILTSIVTYLPYMHPLCKILNTSLMSICLVRQNDGTWVEKHQCFLFNVYKRFFIFVTFLRFLTFFTSMVEINYNTAEPCFAQMCRLRIGPMTSSIYTFWISAMAKD